MKMFQVLALLTSAVATDFGDNYTPPPTVLKDTDISGHDFFLEANSRWERCYTACGITAKCTHFSFHHSNRTCLLKNVDGEPTTFSMKGVDSSEKTLTPVMIQDMDLVGDDYFAAYDYTFDRCSEACSLMFMCTHFTYTQSGGCWLKMKTGSPITTPREGLISSDKPFRTIKIPNAKITGNKLQEYNDLTLGECSSNCMLSDECKFWTHEPVDVAKGLRGPCTMYSTNESLTYSRGATSGNKPYKRIDEDGIKYYGSNVSFQDHPDVETCRIDCTIQSDCTHYTYDESTRECFLFDNVIDRLKISSFVSGSAPELIYLKDTDIMPYGYKYISESTVDLCRSNCMEDPECLFWSYDPAGSCALKTGLSSYSTKKDFTAVEKELKSVEHVGFRYEGDAVRGDATWSLSEYHCRVGCMLEPMCKGYTYHVNEGMCTLLQSISSIMEDQNYNSGSRPFLTVQFLPNQEEKYYYKASRDQLAAAVHNFEFHQCYKLCATHPDCKYLNWFVTDGTNLLGRCEILKTYNTQEVRVGGPFRSMPKPDMFSIPGASVTIEAGDGVIGACVKSVTVEDVNACANACLEEPQCSFYEYLLLPKGLCHLSQAGQSFTIHESSAVLATRPFIEKDNVGQSISDGIKSTVQPVQVDDIAQCRKECHETEDCNYWNYDSVATEAPCALYQTFVSLAEKQGSTWGDKPAFPISGLPTAATVETS